MSIKRWGMLSFIIAGIVVLLGAGLLLLPLVFIGIAWLIAGCILLGIVDGRRQAAYDAEAAYEAAQPPTHEILIDVVNTKTGEITPGVRFE